MLPKKQYIQSNHKSLIKIVIIWKKWMKVLDVSKAIQERVKIRLNLTKANVNFFAHAICFYFNKLLENGKFLN